ncbi:MerR family transcriptional regulator [Paenibacillus frigoriresistens]|jgi:DNA-binding transcriptional MerR regulator|uniref:MerR family transcriptional regulator n=1 Tax=Paenibacillus alginolyticus TaxID=59839 RepID=UPI001567A1FF|nr:MerR family transcriptional regulator [Paenibacillus frigoriresistens]NRF95090.1 MerR family transcriptional regulator [Paenibacillus frigoriresistens]
MENTYTSKQVSEETGLSIPTLRYYEEIGLIRGIERDDHGYRLYSQSDLAWFHFLKYFRAIGMPIRELKQVFALHHLESTTTTARRQFMESYRQKVVDQLKELEQTLERIDDKIELFKNLEALENGFERGRSTRMDNACRRRTSVE